MADATEARRGRAAPPKRRGRRPTLYDAVAGLIRSRVPRTADGTVSGRLVLAPDEAVFRARNAPPRFEETDRYFAHEGLPAAGAGDGGERVLPAGALVAAVHRYASGFYEGTAAKTKRTPPPRRLLDERSMDETALLAVGILLEEACRGLLGREGELVFTEGGEEDDEEEEEGEEGEEGEDGEEEDGEDGEEEDGEDGEEEDDDDDDDDEDGDDDDDDDDEDGDEDNEDNDDDDAGDIHDDHDATLPSTRP